MSAALELQKAIFAALSADTDLTALVGSRAIHDHAPANLAFPYITFGRNSASDWSTSTEDGSEHIFTVHVWSKETGKSQALGIMAVVRRVLHDASLTLSGYQLVNLRDEYADVRFNDDHAVYHGTLRFRAITEATI
jgi:hypothetical protein